MKTKNGKNNIVIISFFLLFTQTLTAQSVEEIIDNHIKARGGHEKINAIKNVCMKGSQKWHDLTGVSFRNIIVQDSMFRTDIVNIKESGFILIKKSKDKIKEWMFDPYIMKSPQRLEPDTVMNWFDIRGNLFNYRNKGFQPTLMGKDSVLGRECFQILLTPGYGIENTYWIDTQTYLLLQQQPTAFIYNEADWVPLIDDYPKMQFSNYRSINGVMFPFTIKEVFRTKKEIEQGEIYYNSIETNILLAKELYKPKAIKEM